MPRPSSPLDAKASVRSPYALDRSQQNSCVGVSLCRPAVRRTGQAPTHALRYLSLQTMMSSRIHPRASSGGQPDRPFNSRCQICRRRPKPGRKLVFPRSRGGLLEGWWSQTGSNRRPHACKARALPTELWPLSQEAGSAGSTLCEGSRRSVCPPEVSHEVWWAQADSNCRPHAYQACALTN